MKNHKRKIHVLKVEKRIDCRTKKRGNIPQHFVLPPPRVLGKKDIGMTY